MCCQAVYAVASASIFGYSHHCLRENTTAVGGLPLVWLEGDIDDTEMVKKVTYVPAPDNVCPQTHARPVYFITPDGDKIDSIGLPLPPLIARNGSTTYEAKMWKSSHAFVISAPPSRTAALHAEQRSAVFVYVALCADALCTICLYVAAIQAREGNSGEEWAGSDVFGPRLGRWPGEAAAIAVCPTGNADLRKWWRPVTVDLFLPAETIPGQIHGVSPFTDANTPPFLPRGLLGLPFSAVPQMSALDATDKVGAVLALLAYGAIAVWIRPCGTDRCALWDAAVAGGPTLDSMFKVFTRGEVNVPHAQGARGTFLSARMAILIARALALPVFVAALLTYTLGTATGVFPASALGIMTRVSGANTPSLFVALIRLVLDVLVAWRAHALILQTGPAWFAVTSMRQYYC